MSMWDDIDIIFGVTWIETLGMISLKMTKKCLSFWHNKIKITLYDLSMES
jgi:hypothetical protein